MTDTYYHIWCVRCQRETFLAPDSSLTEVQAAQAGLCVPACPAPVYHELSEGDTSDLAYERVDPTPPRSPSDE